MPWFRIDDKFGEHPKVRAIPRAKRRTALGLWVLAGPWCSLNLTDGHVPGYMVDDLGCTARDAAELVRVGLWHVSGHDCGECGQPRDPEGFIFHGWAEFQPTKAEVEAKRTADADRQREYRERKKAERSGGPSPDRHNATPPDGPVSHATVRPSRPDPSRPDPSVLTTGGHRHETLRASSATTPPNEARCTEHAGMVTPPPCRGCKTAREAAEQSETRAKAAAAERRASCRLCGGTGWIENAAGDPVRQCKHLELVTG